MARALPAHWQNGESAKCDVMFLWDDLDGPEGLERLTIKEGLDEVMYVPGAILWRVERKNVTKSGMFKIPGSDLYGQMTVRNCNTLCKLADLIGRADAWRILARLAGARYPRRSASSCRSASPRARWRAKAAGCGCPAPTSDRQR